MGALHFNSIGSCGVPSGAGIALKSVGTPGRHRLGQHAGFGERLTKRASAPITATAAISGTDHISFLVFLLI